MLRKSIIPITLALLGTLLLSSYNLSYSQSPKRGMKVVNKESSSNSSNAVIEGNYWALIIGINKYINLPRSKQLEAARPDAQAVAALLRDKYGFQVVELYDKEATRKAIYSKLRAFARELGDRDNLLIYYAGHGEYDKETNLGGWLPSDAKPDETDTYISNEEIRAFIKSIKARHIYTIADSCFSQGLMGKKTRSVTGNASIKELYSEKSRWILTSGGLYPVPDKGKGRHSIFAHYLIKILERNNEQYLPVDNLGTKLRDMVSNETSQQTPRSAPVSEVGDDGGQFIFLYAKARQVIYTKDSKVGVDDLEITRQQDELAREKARLEEQMRMFREKARQAEIEIERETLSLKKKHEEEKRRMEREKRRLEQERPKKEEAIFLPPAF